MAGRGCAIQGNRAQVRRPWVIAGLAAVLAVAALAILWRREAAPAAPGSSAPTPEAYGVPTKGEAGLRLRRAPRTSGPDVLSDDEVRQTVAEAIRNLLGGGVLADSLSSAPAAGLTEAELIVIILDENQPLAARRAAVWRLAESSRVESLAALKEVIGDSVFPVDLRAAAAEALGRSPVPGARDALIGLLKTDESADVVLRGAVRGLAAIGDADAVGLLGRLLQDAGVAESVRAEAADGLGTVESPLAGALLVAAFRRLPTDDSDMAESILRGLAQRDFGETEPFFRALATDPAIPVAERVTAIEALGNADGYPGRFLLGVLKATEPEVRAAAAWALATHQDPGEMAPALLAALATEPEASVRLGLYQALTNQDSVDPAACAEQVLRERDFEARLAGYNLCAGLVQKAPDSQVADLFAKTAVPELTAVALGSTGTKMRLAAVAALQRAATPEANAALTKIAAGTKDTRVAAAVRGGEGRP